MNRLHIAITLLVVALGISFLCFYVMTYHTDHLIQNLESVLVMAEDNSENLVEKTKEIEKLWDNTSVIMHILIAHEELLGLEIKLLSLQEHALNEDVEKYKEACTTSILYLEHIKDTLVPSWGNIF
ncbi:MAG TPA: DUF4363 family protein [Clostridia bacterium]|nr:DUF4363 family protein [Clostridia bacterium]